MPDRRHLIDAESLLQCLDDPTLRVVDCRFDLADSEAGQRQYLDTHIPGAVFADLDRDLSVPPRADTGRHPLPEAASFAQTLGQLGIDNSTQVVVYDAGNGALAARAWWMLRWAGHEQVVLLDGGFQRWLELDLPVQSGNEPVATAEFVASPRDEIILTTEELVAQLSAIADLRLVDARDAVRFRGESEPIDPVAGHIPGSINLPLDRSLRTDGTWKGADELRALWQDVLGTDPEVAWSVMCGSGVTACHLAISGMIAGYREPRLYVGSWSEWIRDPARPVALREG